MWQKIAQSVQLSIEDYHLRCTKVLNGPLWPLFLYFCLFSTVDGKHMFNIKVC